MLCKTCNTKSNRIKVINGQDYCGYCSSISETGGAKIDGSITRNSFRIREQQRAMSSDMEPPHIYDKASRKPIANPNFIRNFPNEAKKTFTKEELKKANAEKLL